MTNYKNISLLVTLLASLVIFLPQSMAASVYKWVDESGKVHYGERPPEKGEAKVIKTPRRGYEQDAPADRIKKIQEQNKAFDEARQKRQEEQQKTAKEQARREKNCGIARKNLDTYLRTKKIRKGDEVVRISDDEWQKKVDEARKLIAKFCD